MLCAYYYPMREEKILGQKALDTIFRHFEVIFKINGTFLIELEEFEKRIATDPSQSMKHVQYLAELLTKFSPSFRLYSNYVTNYTSASERLREVKNKNKSKKLKKHIKKQVEFLRSINCRQTELESLLVCPIQRLPRYSLLLRDLLETIPEKENSTIQELNKAIEIIKQVNEYCNEKQRVQESSDQLDTLSKKLQIKNVNGRKLVRAITGRGSKLSASIDGKTAECDLYLFNDALVIAFTNGKKKNNTRLVSLKKDSDCTISKGRKIYRVVINLFEKDKIDVGIYYDEFDNNQSSGVEIICDEEWEGILEELRLVADEYVSKQYLNNERAYWEIHRPTLIDSDTKYVIINDLKIIVQVKTKDELLENWNQQYPDAYACKVGSEIPRHL